MDGVNELVTRAPAANRLSFTVHGLEAHAGICPERGISAVQVASEAIAGMRLGRVDSETTANLGVIHGGLATNIVPNQVVVRGETRSLSEAKLAAQTAHMRGRFEEAVARHAVTLEGHEHRARLDVQVERQYERLSIAVAEFKRDAAAKSPAERRRRVVDNAEHKKAQISAAFRTLRELAASPWANR